MGPCKGEGGSVGGWTVGGADVRVGRGSDSSRDDGRHLLVISRPPAYKLTFSFNTTYEQARMIQALSSSGATVTGLDAIMLLKNLKKQQEEDQEEEEERQRQLQEQKKALEESRQRNDTLTSVSSVVEERKEDVVPEDDEVSIEYEKNKEEEEVEVNRSIYDSGTGFVNNPLYSSQINLSICDEGGVDVKDKTHSTYTYSGTSGVSDTSALASDATVGNQDSVGKVNPVPKPPRTSGSERRPSTESQSFQSDDEAKNFTEARGPRGQQQSSSSRGEEGQEPHVEVLEEGLPDVRSVQDEEEDFRFDTYAFGEGVDEDEEIVEARNRLYSNADDSEEGEGFYQVNSDSEEDIYHGGSDSNPRQLSEVIVEGDNVALDFLQNDPSSDSSVTEEEKEEEETLKEFFEGNYSDLLNKMKLERALSIDSEANGHSPDFGSPAAYRKNSLNSPIDISLSNSPTLDDRGSGSDKEENGRYGSGREDSGIQSPDEAQKIIQEAVNDALSDSEEKFEQLYNRIRSDSSEYQDAEDYEYYECSEQTTEEKNIDSVQEGEVEKFSVNHEEVVKENGHITGEDMADSPVGSPSETTAKKRVNSIIKKRDKGVPTSGTGTVKKVQFNLEIEKIESPATSESPVTAADAAEKTEELTIASAKEKLDSATDKEKIASAKSVSGNDAKKEATDTARASPTTEKKTTDSSAGSRTKKETSEPKSPSSPSKKKSQGSPLTSPSKKKPTEPSNNTLTQPKKKGIFSSIFSSSSNKKSDSSSAKDDTSSKKKSSDSPTQSIKRQHTVDLTAPLIITGQVEIGGSVGGRLNPRRIEVRDGHVLAFLPRGSPTPSSRIGLAGLSVSPVLGSTHAHILSLTRATRCMMVVKLESREELMLWVHTLSDEVIKVTPEEQRSGLTLYPTPAKTVDEKDGEKKDTRENQQQQESRESEKKERGEKAAENGVAEDVGTTTKVASSVEEISVCESQQPTVVNGEPLDNLDDRGNTVLHEADEDHVFSPQRSASVDSLDELSERRRQSHPCPKYHKRTSSENGEEIKIGSRIQTKIRQLSLEQLQPESTTSGKTDNFVRKKNYDSRNNHQPLRRLSGQEKGPSPPKDLGTDTVDNFLFVNNLPGPSSDRQANSYQPTENLNRFSRIISSSESSLRPQADYQGSGEVRPVQRCGSEILSHANTRDQYSHAGNRLTREKVPTRGPGYRGSQTSTSDSDCQLVNEARASPTYSSSSQSLSHYNLGQPRKIEIIENSRSIRRHSEGKGRTCSADDDQWFGDDSSGTEAPTLVKDEAEVIPRITWSVAATREKFELLCSVSGENKGRRLTTRTPISRKRSGRGTVKKKRSLEGAAVSRRSTVRRGVRLSREEDVRLSLDEDFISSSQEFQADASDSNKDLQTQQEMRLQPTRINFEKDTTRSSSPAVHRKALVEAESSSPTTGTSRREDSVVPKKPFLRRTSNVMQEPYSPASSPEPRTLTSRSLNTRPPGSSVGGDKGRATRSSSSDSSRPSSAQDNDVVVCWRGPYIAQDPTPEVSKEGSGAKAPHDLSTEKEAEQAVLSNISNAFLAKRRLLSREVAAARIQERLSLLEERLWDLQASMAAIDVSGVVSGRETREWKSLEKSLRAVEEETVYWNTRLTQTQKEAEQARQKLAAALSSGLAQLGPATPDQHRPQSCDPDSSEA